jgi:transposase
MEKLTYACSKNKSNIYLANESYTTKCCGRCGTLNNVGSSEIFNCIKCGLQQDRDLHAARNIYLRRVTMKN